MNNRPFQTALSIASLALILSCCAEYEPPIEPLSSAVFTLGNTLVEKPGCKEKSTYLHQWLGKNASKLKTLKNSFDKDCNPKNITCMSHHILSSAHIEVALRECRTDTEIAPTLKSDIDDLNNLAGLAVRF